MGLVFGTNGAAFPSFARTSPPVSPRAFTVAAPLFIPRLQIRTWTRFCVVVVGCGEPEGRPRAQEEARYRGAYSENLRGRQKSGASSALWNQRGKEAGT